ncbi:3-oxoacyl-[acyl-carrier protein] reductase [Exophiala aquamarina CBS 119918]|uniref:3-oxoacyl-[acyl-carrier protein] reductase n=1 Tax=Exophiala aquamarina CBS 119918 TaxID=1182545 RepID=A0A072P673_9EURO|nr:3-oxoacyl-[acyl-carrier protein] reductase [Exophiala aquamarina CBS 119918]KEF51125.1 3-oxoacyl-[acyl-carrier protein] reductase [Exophiala aquamarina CBS 119918]
MGMFVLQGCNSPLGIGRATAHQYAQNGAHAIYLCDARDDYLETHKKELHSLYPTVNVHCKQLDVSDEAAVKDVVDEVIKDYGRLDIIFANAGIASPSAAVSSSSSRTFASISADQFMRLMAVNALGFFLCAKYAAQAMMRTSPQKPSSSGSIIGTASIAGMRANAGSVNYSASKAAVISITQTMAYQLTGTLIRVNAICPGLIETSMTQKLFEQARDCGSEPAIAQLNPLQRGALPDEVARVALFLGSDEASYVNGQSWAVCGGYSAGHPFAREI